MVDQRRRLLRPTALRRNGVLILPYWHVKMSQIGTEGVCSLCLQKFTTLLSPTFQAGRLLMWGHMLLRACALSGTSGLLTMAESCH